MSAKIMFIHLSDIHVESAADAILSRPADIASTTYQRLPEVQTIVLILSGDIAWSGTEKQYALVETMLTEIRKAILSESPSMQIEVFVCPGNHDCDFSAHDDTREAVISRVRQLEGVEPSESLIKTASSVQDQFFAFRARVSSHKWAFDNRLLWQTSINVAGSRVGIRCLNVAWMSELKEKQGALIYPPTAIVPFTFDKLGGLSITLLHHPFNWFGQSNYRAFQAAVRRESHIIFTGHEHFQNVGEVADLQSSPSIFIEGGVLFEAKEPALSTFNIVIVDVKTEQYSTELYSWDGKRYIAEVDNEEWGSLRALPVKGRPSYELTKEFSSSLSDPGANFSHSAKKSLAIEDIFVWPELLCLDDPSLVKKQVSGAYLEDIENLNSGVFIRGDEKSGKSTLLRRYFSSYYGRGYLPLYFRGSWFTKTHQRETLKALKFALEKQYVRGAHQGWLQESKSQRVLLLDDIDACTLSPEVLSRCLNGLFGYFSAIILTAKEGAAAMDLLSIDRVEALHKFTQYEVREFGHKKRFELVCKWAEIGGQEDESSAKWTATIDRWEKDLTTAVGRQFVPSVPIFLLTLLQSIESGRTADLQNSAFGHYYQFLVTSALQEVEIEREQWSEVFNYCANLAWFIHSSGKRQLSENELEGFNSAFSSEFTPVPFARRMRELIRAGVLAKLDGEIEFKYPYLYYYFLGQYLADRIHEPAIEQVINVLCEDLHLRDNANILLFTSHHTRSPVIYEKIADALARCFETTPVFDFVTDVALLNKLVDSAPQLIYHEESTKDARSKAREEQDRSEDSKPAKEEGESGTDAFAAVTRLFRGMEILGQFLKNHYGTTKNPVKEALIEEILQSALRGLRGTTIVLLENTDAMAGHVERMLLERRPDLQSDARKTLSKRIVFDIIGMITHAFVHKAGSTVGSAYLKENLRNVVDKDGTLGYSLIEMSYRFDLPEAIAFTKLKQLNKLVENNVFSQALLRSMALRHLHLFKVPYKDKQKLCEELGITLNRQLALQHERSSRQK
ncbi:metallophosphoesterase [Polaromonas sp.]|uniref:STAND family AAA ATPase n=1 Tax=Polaromonas sp. TaxID=1869339 RepID=UPI0032639495